MGHKKNWTVRAWILWSRPKLEQILEVDKGLVRR
jgi:hypothetical protein